MYVLRVAVIALVGVPPLLAQGPERTYANPNEPRFLIPAADAAHAPAEVDPARVPVIQRRISLSLDNATRADALRAIGQASGLNVAYESQLVRGGAIHLRGDTISIANALTTVLTGTNTDILLAANGSLIVVAKPGSASAPQAVAIRGRVVAPDTARIVGAIIAITSLPDSATQRVAADSTGHYAASLSPGAVRVSLFVTAPGFAARRVEFDVGRSASATLLPDIRIERSIQTLAPVTTRARRARVQRADQASNDFGPGQSSRFLGIVNLSDGLTGDPTGSLASALGTLPSLSVIPSATGGLPTISAFGLGGGDNSATLNGLSFNGGSIPPDGFSLQAVTSTYDPGKGGYAGVNASLRFPSGSPTSDRALHATSNAPFVQSESSPLAQFAGRPQLVTAAGSAHGSMNDGNTVLYNTSAQLVRSESSPLSLARVNPSTLAAVGVDGDSLQRILGIMSQQGIPGPNRASSQRAFNSGIAFGRLDYRPHPELGPRGPGETSFSPTDDQLSVLVGLNASNSSSGPGGFSLAAPANSASSRGGMAAATLSRYAFGWLLNESSVSLQFRENSAGPDLELPAASVRLGPSSTANTGLSSLAFGGTGSGQGSTQSSTIELRNESAWYTVDSRHQFKITVDGVLDNYQSTPAPSFGQFTYYSIDDLAAGLPAVFSRATPTGPTTSHALNAAVAIGDVFVPFLGQANRGQLQMQYGLRAEMNGFTPTPSPNPTLQSALNVGTNEVPRVFAITPMFGFTEPLGQIRLTNDQPVRSRGALFGGVREYRDVLSAAALDPYLRRTGLATGTGQLLCVGPQVPSPNWGSFANSTAAVPTQCVGGTGSQTVEQAPDVSVFAPTFDVTSSWRPTIGWSGFVTPTMVGGMNVTFADNRGRPDVIDVNFDPTVRFTLPSEANRPVYAQPGSIDPRTGTSLAGASRVSPLFGSVLETRSDLQQQLWQANVMLARTIGSLSFASASATVAAAYAFTAGNDDSRGFSSNTAGDPRAIERSPSSIPHHTGTFSISLHVPRWGSMGGFVRVASPLPFTPRISGDINGDGLANDRPFVFDPKNTADQALATGMQSLLTSAPGPIRRCLADQLGRIAGRNSCPGGVMTTLNLTASPDPYLLHLGNRGTVTLMASNVLGGLDALLHDPSHLRGWGATQVPDATLLQVTGFDPATKQFKYTVNPAFGTTSTARNIWSAPFTLTIDFRVNIAPDYETRQIVGFLAPAKTDPSAVLTEAQIRARFSQTPPIRFTMLLRARDSLRLTTAQVDSVNAILNAYMHERSAAYDGLAHALAARRGEYGSDAGREDWHDTIVSLQRKERMAWARVRALLTAEQYAQLNERMRFLDLVSPSFFEYDSKKPRIGPP